jgi:hypothetical protein
MEQSPSWGANKFSASQEIPCILWNLEVCYHIHKCPPPLPNMSQINPVGLPIQVLEDTLQYYPPIYAKVFNVVSFPQYFPSKPCMDLSCPPHMQIAPPFCFFLI